jgi:hypothetical protein
LGSLTEYFVWLGFKSPSHAFWDGDFSLIFRLIKDFPCVSPSNQPPCRTQGIKYLLFFPFDGVEFNPGIGFKFGRFDILVSHRLYNFTKKDGLIFYYDLFYKGYDDPFLLDRYEWFNPKKYWITVGYQIRQ